MATVVCTKIISLKVWDADSTPIGSPIVSIGDAGVPNTPVSGSFGNLIPGYYRCNNVLGGTSAVGFTLDNAPDPGTFAFSRGGGYGDCPEFPPCLITPDIGALKGWTSHNADSPTAEAACNAGMLTLEPLLDFELLVDTVVGWSHPGFPANVCGRPVAAWNGAAGLQFSLTRIGKE